MQDVRMTAFRQTFGHLVHPPYYVPVTSTYKETNGAFTIREHNTGEAWFRLSQQLDSICCKAVVITANPCPEYTLDLLELGVCAVLQIGVSDQSELLALEFARRGVAYTCATSIHSFLAPRERQLLRYVIRGWSNQQIAVYLGKSIATVRNYLNEILKILGLQNRTQLAMYYLGHWQLLGRSNTDFQKPDAMSSRVS
jgi:DNA-binding NarL/FixJ family response regulator